jgi:glucoamylase
MGALSKVTGEDHNGKLRAWSLSSPGNSDGPALRALALIPYARFILDRGFPSDLAYVRNHLYDPSVIRDPGKVIKNDLEEVAHTWDQPGFDLWEEV